MRRGTYMETEGSRTILRVVSGSDWIPDPHQPQHQVDSDDPFSRDRKRFKKGSSNPRRSSKGMKRKGTLRLHKERQRALSYLGLQPMNKAQGYR